MYCREMKDMGSSPLARGLPRQIIHAVSVTRIIPARAGFTGKYQLIFRAKRDHPRSRGVYKVSRFTVILYMGSSPLARGLRSVISWTR